MPEFNLNRNEVLGKPLGRVFTSLERVAVDPENERVIQDVALATDTPIYQWFGAYVILDMAESSIRMDRMKASGAALWCHDRPQQIGRWQGFRIEKNKLRADCKFSRGQLGDEKLQDVKDDVLVTTSVGFSMYDIEPEIDTRTDEQMYMDGTPVFRCKDWEPFEGSWEPIPADIGAGTNRALDPEAILQSAEKRNSTNEERTMPNNTPPTLTDSDNNGIPDYRDREWEARQQSRAASAPPPPANPATPVETRTVSPELAIATEIRSYAEVIGATTFAESYMQRTDEAITLAGFRAALKASLPENPTIPVNDPATEATRQGGIDTTAQLALARSMPRHGEITSFRRTTRDEAALAAYRFGSFMLATVLRKHGDFNRSFKFCRENGLIDDAMYRAMSEGVNAKGGYLVPEEFGNDLIDLRLKYGVFRRNAHIVQMSSDTRTDPRRVSGLTTYFVGESQEITASDMTWDRVTLVLKKLAALSVFSSELDEDAVIDVGNTLADEIAYAFAKKEDECGFIGDGSATYGGIVGILPTLRGLDATIGNIAGIKVGTGNAFSELTLADFLDTMGLMPDYVDTSGDSAKWYVNKAFYFNVMAKLMLAGGGVTAAEIEDRRMQRFLGYPVEFVNVLNKVEGNSVAVGLFGDLNKAATMGIGRDTTITESEHRRFEYDDIMIKGTERFDINVHSVGNADSVAANKQPGPIAALYTAAS